MIKTLRLMLRMLQVREESRLASLRRARGERDKVVKVVGELENYAREYRDQTVRQASAGTTPVAYMETLAFEQKLFQTAHAQKLVVGQLDDNVKQMMAQAVAAKMRVQGLEKILRLRALQAREQRARAEAREIEEGIAARQLIDGMNDASDRSS